MDPWRFTHGHPERRRGGLLGPWGDDGRGDRSPTRCGHFRFGHRLLRPACGRRHCGPLGLFPAGDECPRGIFLRGPGPRRLRPSGIQVREEQLPSVDHPGRGRATQRGLPHAQLHIIPRGDLLLSPLLELQWGARGGSRGVRLREDLRASQGLRGLDGSFQCEGVAGWDGGGPRGDTHLSRSLVWSTLGELLPFTPRQASGPPSGGVRSGGRPGQLHTVSRCHHGRPSGVFPLLFGLPDPLLP